MKEMKIYQLSVEGDIEIPTQLPSELNGVMSFETLLEIVHQFRGLLSDQKNIKIVAFMILSVIGLISSFEAASFVGDDNEGPYIAAILVPTSVCLIIYVIIYSYLEYKFDGILLKRNSTLTNGTIITLEVETIYESSLTRLCIKYYPITTTPNNRNSNTNSNILNNNNNSNNNNNNSTQYEPSFNISDIRENGNDRSSNYVELKMSNFDSDSDLEIEISPSACDNNNISNSAIIL